MTYVVGKYPNIDQLYDGIRLVKKYLVEHDAALCFNPVRFHAVNNVTFEDPLLPDEVTYDFQAFLHYEIEWGGGTTKFLEFRTFDRLAFAEHRMALEELLFNDGFSVMQYESWCWGTGEEVNICHPVYYIRFWKPKSNEQPKKLNRIKIICRAPDSRVDDSPFQIIRRTGHKFVSGYMAAKKLEWGIRYELYAQEDAEAVKSFFSDCMIKEEQRKKGKIVIEITFPT